jgi:hypothetical protein
MDKAILSERHRLLQALQAIHDKRDIALFIRWQRRLLDEHHYLVDQARHKVLPPILAHLYLERIAEIESDLRPIWRNFSYQMFKIMQRAKVRRGDATMLIVTNELPSWAERRVHDIFVRKVVNGETFDLWYKDKGFHGNRTEAGGG